MLNTRGLHNTIGHVTTTVRRHGFLNKVSVQTGSSQVRGPLMGNYSGAVTQTHPVGCRDDKNRGK